MRQPALAHYRLPVFQELASRDGIELRLLYGVSKAIPNVDPVGLDALESPLRTMSCPGLGEWYLDPAVRNEIQSYRADVLLTWWNARQLDTRSIARWARRRGVGTAIWGHGVSKRDAWWRRALRDRQAKVADAVITYSRSAREAVSERGISNEKLFVAPNTLDQRPNREAAEYWADHGEELAQRRAGIGVGPGPIIGFVSRLDPLNRLDLLIDALPEVRKSVAGAQVLAVGRGDEELARLQRMARERGVEDCVIFMPPEYDARGVGAYLAMSEVYCYPSNMGLSLLHAFAFGLPVVTSDAVDLHGPEIEYFEDHVHGRFYRAGDARSLAERLVEVLTQGDAGREAMRAATRRAAYEQYTLGAMADGLESACRFAASRTRG